MYLSKHSLFTRIAILILKSFSFYTLEKLIDPLLFFLKLFGIEPAQIKEEVLFLIRVLKRIRPKIMLEIGTGRGGTLFLFTNAASSVAKIITVDLPGGPFGGGYPRYMISLLQSFGSSKQKVYLLRTNSHDAGTFAKVKSILNGEKLDFLFIDGDHSYEGVRKDFEMYSPLVRKGGIIAFHDIVPGPPENVGGVPKFWDEIKHNFCYEEIVKDWKQGGYGIGVIYM